MVKQNKTQLNSLVRIYYNSCILEHITGDVSRLQVHCSQYFTTTPGKNMTKNKKSVSGKSYIIYTRFIYYNRKIHVLGN